jgi:ribonuclease BN (tRNA processing enzyme)
MNDFNLFCKLYGVRGSYPVSPPDGTKIGGNTPCLLVRSPEHIIIFDAGSGLAELGKSLVPEILEHKKKNKGAFHISILFSHTHLDHLMGLPFFIPLFMPEVHIHFYGSPSFGMDFEQIIRTYFMPQFFPVEMHELRSVKSFENIDEDTVISFISGTPQPIVSRSTDFEAQEGEITVTNMKYYFHPKNGSQVYKISYKDHNLVFATDIEAFDGGDARLAEFAHKADVLIHDAQYTPQQYRLYSGYGHSSYEMACRAGIQAEVKKLLLFHHDPSSSDEHLKEIEKSAKKIFSASELATESWEWKL